MEFKELIADQDGWEGDEKTHPKMRTLLGHHFDDHLKNCPTISGIEQAFAGWLCHQATETDNYEPTRAEMVIVNSINAKIEQWLRNEEVYLFTSQAHFASSKLN